MNPSTLSYARAAKLLKWTTAGASAGGKAITRVDSRKQMKKRSTISQGIIICAIHVLPKIPYKWK
jgi:hypothetical protein